ncbi:Hsp20 family protein [Flocculibacter collagenilyticus]|uniref:Hsp20 family protein n=1 Tax=Flocculibacter collagenilyticus TaxID=2744479 RepID=UPI0018F5788A|nr:Hsp20 family protein [Flocculibacter collagenilyticus]
MRNIDLSPLHRSFIGFDHLASLLEGAQRAEKSPSYPPYNIELIEENNYRVTLAVAGFSMNELEIETHENNLIIRGNKESSSNKSKTNFLHQGIAERNFERKFQLGDYVRVEGANLENGLLHVELIREIPEQLKPRKIQISTNNHQKPLLEGKLDNNEKLENKAEEKVA